MAVAGVGFNSDMGTTGAPGLKLKKRHSKGSAAERPFSRDGK